MQGTSVDDGVHKSNNWLDQWQSGKLGSGSSIHSFPRAFSLSTNIPFLLLNQPTISRGWKVQYIYSVNEVHGNDQPKRDTFFRLVVYVDKGQRLH